MSEWQTKRFWKATEVTQTDDGFGVVLDGRPVRTPSKALLALPTPAFAQAVQREWEAVEEKIDPNAMPFTRTANAAIDKVSAQHAEVAEMIAEYGATDLLCYRAESPAELRARQDAAWDPLLDWAAQRFEARLKVTSGVMHVAQPEAALLPLRAQVSATTPFELAALHDLVSLSGSLILGLASTDPAFDAETLWALSRIDETWQEEKWGKDDEASALAAYKKDAFFHAVDVWHLCRQD